MSGRRACAAAALTVAAAALAGCARAATDLVFLEAPLWAALDGGSLAERLMPVGRQVGRRFEVRQARSDRAPVRELEELLDERPYRGVVVGPLLALEIDRIAPAFAGVEFVAFRLEDAGAEGAASPPLPANVTELRFARGDGHRRAGRLLALIEPDGAIGIISVRGRDESAIAAFREGYADGGGRASIDHRRLLSTRDRGEIRRLVEDLGGRDVTTVLLRAGPLTADGLEVMRGEGMRAIVANWGLAGGEARRPLADAVLCSIDDDLPGALLALLRARDGATADGGTAGAAGEQAQAVAIDAGHVEYRVNLRWGGAASLPDDAAGYVDRPAGS